MSITPPFGLSAFNKVNLPSLSSVIRDVSCQWHSPHVERNWDPIQLMNVERLISNTSMYQFSHFFAKPMCINDRWSSQRIGHQECSKCTYDHSTLKPLITEAAQFFFQCSRLKIQGVNHFLPLCRSFGSLKKRLAYRLSPRSLTYSLYFSLSNTHWCHPSKSHNQVSLGRPQMWSINDVREMKLPPTTLTSWVILSQIPISTSDESSDSLTIHSKSSHTTTHLIIGSRIRIRRQSKRTRFTSTNQGTTMI